MKPQNKLKIHKFLKKYSRLIGLIILTIIVIYAINNIVRLIKESKSNIPKTSYEPDVAILNSKKTPTKIQNSVEDFIDEFMGYCNSEDYDKAYEMLSEDCKKDYFISKSSFENYIKNRFAGRECYSIQSYSMYNKKYIYTLKLFDDILASGLTNSKYMFLEEKIVAYYDENKKVVFNIGGFIEKEEMKAVQENNYIKADIKERYVGYDYETYRIKLTNKSEYIAVIQDKNVNEAEIVLDIGTEKRENQIIGDVVVYPGNSKEILVTFNKFYDDGDESKSIVLNNVRIMENYTGKEEVAQEEINNAIEKMAIEIGF